MAAIDDLPSCPEPRPGGAVVGAGWLGVLGYQLGRHFERLAPPAVEPPGPPGRLGYYESVIVQDAGGAWWFEAVAGEEAEGRVEARWEHARAALERAAGPGGDPGCYRVGDYALEPGREAHAAAVAAVKAYIEAGDVFQVNACLHALASFEGDPLELFCTGLECLRPRYGAFVRTPGGAVCSFSPELFLRVEGRSVLTSPIKGTARREDDDGRAEAARAALVASAKDGAENAMIVDLMRNDLGRVCTPGSVQVTALARAEAHPGVWHLVSDVVGELAPGRGYGDLLAAAFPAGSITGAPKVRAMEIVNELEPVGRGAYTGSVVLSSPLAGLTANVAIRTFEVRGEEVRLGVGGGIVADSDVAAEVEECFTKARPLLAATGGRLEVDAVRGPVAGGVSLRPRPARGVFETVRVEGGRAPLLARHLARLAASVEEVLGRRLPAEVGAAAAARAAELAGVHRLRVAVRPAGVSVRVELTSEALEAAPRDRVGLDPVLLEGGLGRHKWLDRRLLAALRPAGMAAGDQVLLVDGDGAVLEAERASCFAVVDGVVRTPAAQGAILPGVARAVVLEQARRRGLPLVEGRLGLDELARASEVFVTNALRGVERAGRLGARRLPPATPVADELAAALRGAWAAPAPVRSGGEAPSDAEPSPPRRSRRRAGPVVVVDNVDSFTYNLTQALACLGAASVVVRSTEVAVSDVAGLEPSAIVISPGACTPDEAGISVELVRRLSSSVPTLGVCLGHQCIAAAYGATVVRAPLPVHGKTSPVAHDGSPLFAGIAPSFEAARYHSLVVDEATLPERLVVSARSGTVVMGIRHLDAPVAGVQFHPESFLTGAGERILSNFLRWARR